jgi:hypothetical protein
MIQFLFACNLLVIKVSLVISAGWPRTVSDTYQVIILSPVPMIICGVSFGTLLGILTMKAQYIIGQFNNGNGQPLASVRASYITSDCSIHLTIKNIG